MKKSILSVFILSSLFGFGQITIDNSHMPNSGDTLRYSLGAPDTALLLNFQNSGSNITWNFDSLVPQRQGVQEYKSSSQTPYSSSVTNRIAEKVADTLSLGGFEFYDAYNFYTSNSTSFSMDYRGVTAPTGLSFPFPSTLKIAQSFSDKDEVYQFPLDYQDYDSSTYKFVYSNQLASAYYSSSGYRINDVDAWGSLTTPYGTFNCIRVVTDIVGYDTVSFGTTSFGVESHQREYKWLTTQFEIPALTLSGTVVGGVFIPNTVQYRDSVRNVPSVLAPFAIFLANRTAVEIGDTVEFTNSSISLLPVNYQWSISPSTFQYINGTSASTDSLSVVFNDTGYYDVQLIAINSSGRDTLLIPKYIRVDQITGLEKMNLDKSRLKVYPNPSKANSEIRLQFESPVTVKTIYFYDTQGRLINQYDIGNSNRQIEVDSPTKIGTYILKAVTNQGEIHKRLIVD